jgi:hypothetical protein
VTVATFKGTNLSSLDPETGEKVDLFDPHNDEWNEHFSQLDGRILGISPIGRATARLLKMNAPRRVELRQQWLEEAGGS